MPLYAGEMPASGEPDRYGHGSLAGRRARPRLADEAAELKVGDDANLIGPDGAPIAGKVTAVSPALDASSTTVEVWVEAAQSRRHA